MATPDYSKIWGANSPLAKYEFTEADYLRGWEFIGSMPPARTMFDAWMRKADEKMRWLYDNAFSENSLGGFLFWRLPDTAYFVGEKRALQDGPLDVYIECTIAGRTSKEQMKKLPQGVEIGKTFVDGTATWLVRQFATSAALDDHRTKTPLDHPDGSVLKKHLGFEVYDKGEVNKFLDTKVNKSGDTITGDLIVNAITAKNGFKGNLHGVAWKADYPTGFTSNSHENQGWGNQEGRTIASWYTANRGGIDFRENGGQLNIKIDGYFYQGEGIHRVLDSSGGYLTGTLNFANNIGTCLQGVMGDNDHWRIYAGNNGSNQGYLAIDIADDGNEPIYVRQFTGGFENQVRCATLLDANGNTLFPVSVATPRFYANDWFRALGDTGLHFESHGGGWHMTDDEWIRAFNGKNIYTSGKMRCDAGFEGDLRGTADNANNLGRRSLQWILEQINAAKTGIVAGNLEQNGWVKFANGLIVQWGSWGESVQEKSQWFVFPLAFPSRCFKAIVGTSLLQEHVNADMGYQVIALERTRAKIMTQHFSAHISGVLGQIKAAPEFIAIGI